MSFVRSLFPHRKSIRIFQSVGLVLCLFSGAKTGSSAQEVWGVGDNTYGPLGDGTNARRTVFVRTIAATGSGFFPDAISVAAGGTHTLGLLSDGTVFGWGRNQYGELGVGTQLSRTRPGQVRINLPPASAVYLTDVIAISAGLEFSLALKRDGTV